MLGFIPRIKKLLGEWEKQLRDRSVNLDERYLRNAAEELLLEAPTQHTRDHTTTRDFRACHVRGSPLPPAHPRFTKHNTIMRRWWRDVEYNADIR